MNRAGGGLARRAGAWIAARRWRQALVLMAVCAAVFLPRLGATGLSMSEGHRVVPAWEMLEDARAGEPHWGESRMFGTLYLRKPPGMLWAIAGSSAVFGENEFAARLPSAVAATLLAFAVWWFATRWFGSPWGLAAGLAQALLPVTWPSARSAEIESLHLLTTGVACLALLDRFLVKSPRPWLDAHRALLFVSTFGMIVTKGPAGLPFLAAALLCGICIARGTRRRWIMLADSLLVVAVALFAGWWLVRPGPNGEPAVIEGVSHFLWRRTDLAAILALCPAVLGTMLPASVALVFPWGPDAVREWEQERAGRGPESPSPTGVARLLAFAAVVSLLVLTAIGVSNPRYGLPVCALITPLVAYVARGAWAGGVRGFRGPARDVEPGAPEGFIGKRPRIARAMLLGSPAAWPAVLLVGAAVYVGVIEPHRRASSGRGAGIALAAHLPEGAVVWADEMIEARPEVLLYAAREAERQGRDVRVRWLKPGFMPEERPQELLLLLREDELVDEVAWFRRDGRFGALTPIARGEVHKYEFALMRPGTPDIQEAEKKE